MSTTRLLILGAILERGVAHGYQVRRDLESWRAGLWGNIRQGSIYHGLRSLHADGLVEQETPDTDRPAKVEYRVTPAGRAAFDQLLAAALSSDGTDPAETIAGIGFMTTLPRARVLALLQQRVEALGRRRDSVVVEYEQRPDEDWGHHVEAIRLWAHTADSAIAWTRELISRLEAGEHRMADDRSVGTG